jgi:hypothetical protein
VTGAYIRDPRVPPVRIDRLGKHRKLSTHVLMALPAPERTEVVRPIAPAFRAGDAGPTYEEFLRIGLRETASSHRTG